MQFQLIFELVDYQLNRYPKDKSVIQHNADDFEVYSTTQLKELITTQAKKWQGFGIKPGDQIGISATIGSIDWLICDLSLMMVGAIPVNIHTNYTLDELKYVFQETDLKLLLLDNLLLVEKYLYAGPQLTLKALKRNVDLPHYSDLKGGNQLKNIIISPEDVATIIYTSGTSGMPKGVMLSHKNIISNVMSIITLTPLNYRSNVISFLPISHVFERTVVYSYLSSGTTIHFISEPKNILKKIRKVRPNFMTAVPRIIEKLYDQIQSETSELPWLRRKLVEWALHQGMKEGRNNPASKLLRFIKTTIADVLVYRLWRKALGGRIKGIGVGASALNPDLARLFSKAGIPIREGYGLTETSPIVTINRFEPGGVRYGTAGMVIPGVEIKIVNRAKDEGEILVRGPNVMVGYYNNPELTDEKIDKEGWFHTGDIGKIIDKRFLKITDRKKDIFKSSSGRYIAPRVIENQLRANPFVDQCMIIGFQRPFVTALIVPDFEQLKIWCQNNKVHWTSPQFMVLNPRVEGLYHDLIDQFNLSLKSHERIQKVHLLFKEWSIESGEYTTSLKLKRHTIERANQKEISKMYEG